MFNYMRMLSFTVLGAFSSIALAASFDCNKATTLVEKAICQDQSLSTLDDEMAAAFNNGKANSANQSEFIKQQSAWLKTIRNICQTNRCIEKAYQDRIMVLNNNNIIVNTAPAPASTTDIKGEYLRYNAKGKPDYHSASLTLFSPEKGKIKLLGNAVWVGDTKTGNVHIGEVAGTFDLQGEQVSYKDENGCEFVLLLGKNALTVNNDNGQCGGLNVTFNGYYKKVK